MASNTRIISGGTTYYMNGRGSYTGSGTPWTVQNTTPYQLSLNDATGNIWTAQQAPGVGVYGGGPPFRHGRALITKTYDNVTETIGVQLRASSHDNAVFLLRQLRQILSTALYSTPAILAVQPDGATNAAYYEIYAADIQEQPSFLRETHAGFALFRAAISWTRSPFGGASSLATLINGVTIENDGTGTPDDVESLGSLAGDLIYEGQPLNVRFLPVSVITQVREVFLASIASRTYTSHAATQTTSITNDTGLAILGSPVVITIAAARTAVGLRARLMGRFSSVSSLAEIRAVIAFDSSANFLMRRSLWTSTAGPSFARLHDFGGADLAPVRRSVPSSAQIYIQFYVRSTNGSSVSATLDYSELLLYYDFCRIRGMSSDIDTNSYLLVEGANNINGSAYVPTVPPYAYAGATSGDLPELPLPIRGTAPRAFSGASLYVGWNSSSLTHDRTATATLTVTHAPLYQSLRGAG